MRQAVTPRTYSFFISHSALYFAASLVSTERKPDGRWIATLGDPGKAEKRIMFLHSN